MTTSEPRVSHTAELVERHRITIPVGATGDNVAVARLHAEAYARERGFEIKPGSFTVIAASNGMPVVAEGGYLGVAFDVVVGKGDEPGDWTWSGPAASHWYNQLAKVAPGRTAPVIGVVDADGSRRIRPRGGMTGQLPDGRHVPVREVSDNPLPHMRVDRGELHLGDPMRMPGDWRGPEALGGPQPGQGAQAGTGELPPWLRRQDPGYDDTEKD